MSTAERGAAVAHSAGRGDVVRQWVVAVSAVLAIAGALVGSGVFGGTRVQDAAGGALDDDSTLLAPAGPAFSIWSLIYLGLAAYAVWQALPSQRTSDRQRSVGYLVAASMLLNALWIGVVQAGWLWLSVLVIVVLLAVLCIAYRACVLRPPRKLLDALITDGTIGLYLGWVSIATAANVAAALTASGFDGGGIPPEAWAVAVITVAVAAIAALGLWSRGGLAPMLSASWGLAWIAVGRLTGEPASTTVGVAAIAGIVVIVTATLIARFATARNRRLGGEP
ncbi:tryptophan-rich sensory protein [Agromyces sp. CFH 90414]|uniref:Tryptophan-rich sensory protein n=1 Tax=Agromyces agglutinans TaxID=2662258 RepID=A0A6I2F1S9_9MICO|nr:tryptophan-rich sensory protein [Agromyces agglutinans]MRG59435.1 tryptophan-rich sensory protein [Agromyces agglutinans]